MSNHDPLQVLDETQEVAEMYAGMRETFIAQRFTQEQAGDLVVVTMQHIVINMSKGVKP